MIHRAVLGSFERFIGILIEHYGANFPLWLAPEQARVLPISEKTNDYAREVCKRLRKLRLLCTMDISNEKVNVKIAKAHSEKVPYMLVVGPREAQSNAVNVRVRQSKDTKTVVLDTFLAIIKQKIADKEIDLAFECANA
jgi:threonyl-tRNA synthetase